MAIRWPSHIILEFGLGVGINEKGISWKFQHNSMYWLWGMVVQMLDHFANLDPLGWKIKLEAILGASISGINHNQITNFYAGRILVVYKNPKVKIDNLRQIYNGSSKPPRNKYFWN